jgi:hypothetical protein
MEVSRVADKINWFVQHGCRGQSPLYEALCSRLVNDRRLLEIAESTPPDQPFPHLFFAAVQSLLLAGSGHELATYYASCVPDPNPPEAAFPAFRDFCLANSDRIREIMARRRVQTNEVRRCAYLLPAFAHVATQAQFQPLALIEAGTSAGLNLLWDRYTYDYGTAGLAGKPGGAVRIGTELKGGRLIPLPSKPIAVAHRVGVDLHLLDVREPNDRLWLESLIWPEQRDRLQLLEAAAIEMATDPPDLLEGDILDLLPALVQSAPQHAQICLFHCHMLNQLTESQRSAFRDLLAEVSNSRRIFQLSAEWIGTALPELKLTIWDRGDGRTQHLANVDQHGRWIHWLL